MWFGICLCSFLSSGYVKSSDYGAADKVRSGPRLEEEYLMVQLVEAL